MAALTVADLAAAESAPRKTPTTLERLKAGGTTFTNVTITDVTATHLFLKSSQGFANVRLDDLEPDVKALFVREDPVVPATREPQKRATSSPVRPVPVAAREPSTEVRSGLMAKLPQPLTRAIHGWVGGILIATGCCMMVAGWLWLVGVAFRAHIGWGLAVLIGSVTCGLINLIFMATHWQESKRPFGLYLLGALVIGVAAVVSFYAGPAVG